VNGPSRDFHLTRGRRGPGESPCPACATPTRGLREKGTTSSNPIASSTNSGIVPLPSPSSDKEDARRGPDPAAATKETNRGPDQAEETKLLQGIQHTPARAPSGMANYPALCAVCGAGPVRPRSPAKKLFESGKEQKVRRRPRRRPAARHFFLDRQRRGRPLPLAKNWRALILPSR